jgi:hypothetical protein
MHSLSFLLVSGLDASDNQQLSTLAFYLIQQCIACADWSEAYLILFCMLQHKLCPSSCEILSQQEIAITLAAILTKTNHIEDMQSVLDLAEYFNFGSKPSGPQILDKLKALDFLSEVMLNAISSRQLVQSVRDVLMQCAINVFSYLVEQHPTGRFFVHVHLSIHLIILILFFCPDSAELH